MSLCQCGCGRPTPLAKETRIERGQAKGEPLPFLRGHNKRRLQLGERVITAAGYIRIGTAERAVHEHVVLAEHALGRPLPEGVEVHHVDEDRSNNRPGNLVLCQDHGYHFLLHLRARALRACGNPDWRKCWVCGEWDRPENLYTKSQQSYHTACVVLYNKRRRHMKRGARRDPASSSTGRD